MDCASFPGTNDRFLIKFETQLHVLMAESWECVKLLRGNSCFSAHSVSVGVLAIMLHDLTFEVIPSLLLLTESTPRSSSHFNLLINMNEESSLL